MTKDEFSETDGNGLNGRGGVTNYLTTLTFFYERDE